MPFRAAVIVFGPNGTFSSFHPQGTTFPHQCGTGGQKIKTRHQKLDGVGTLEGDLKDKDESLNQLMNYKGVCNAALITFWKTRDIICCHKYHEIIIIIKKCAAFYDCCFWHVCYKHNIN